ncbi:class I SAM-dependent methyltransferase [Nocardia jejuensis]|uniref:class I SAM-dependent methyltransferase n=1 Tax=Nocardia jejuensis TaxID=328049 RepID=UPI00082C6A58|nr:class I SAM-dependent methyltransferase [Nocardia jejuensis]
MAERKASRTAVLVCQGRAAANERLAVGRFSDRVAVHLLTAAERVPVEHVRAARKPSGFGEQLEYELLTATSEVMATRTVMIDDAVRDAAHPQLVILGAGLDARAWRMPELSGTAVFEVDHPASQQEKRERLTNLAPKAASVRFVPVDFAVDSLAEALAEAGHDPDHPTTWIWEGVVPYLTPEEVADTVSKVARLSAPGSRLVITYGTPSRTASLGRKTVEALLALARHPNPMAAEPNRSTWRPAQWQALLSGNGFGITDDRDLLTVARDLEVPSSQGKSLAVGRVLVADRD